METTRINQRGIVLEGAFNTFGMSILGLSSIVPLFLSAYGANMTLIGLVPTVVTAITLIVPLIAGNWIARAQSKKRLIVAVNSIGRPSIILIAVVLLLPFGSTAIIVCFIVLLSIFMSGQSASNIAWQDLFARTIAEEKRAGLLGLLQIISGVCALAASFSVKAILDSQVLSTGQRFALIFGFAGIFLSLSIAAIQRVREPLAATAVLAKGNIVDYGKSLMSCLKDRNFVRFVVVSACNIAAGSGASFLYIFASRDLKLPIEHVSSFVIIQTLGTIASGILWQRIAKKGGPKLVIVIAEVLMVAIPVLALLCLGGTGASIFMYVAIFFYGLKIGSWMGYTNYLLETVDEKVRIQSIVAINTLLFPFSFLNLLAGMLVDRFGMVPLFALQILFAATTTILALATLKGRLAPPPVPA